MGKLSKAIKYAEALSEEEKNEFMDYFKTNVTEDEAKETKQEEKKEEKPKETKAEESNDIIKMFEAMNKKLEVLSERVEKSKSFGVKAQPKQSKDTNTFDEVFAGLVKNQR